jgi:hypothetical protein
MRIAEQQFPEPRLARFFPPNNASSFVLLIADHRLLQSELVLVGDANLAEPHFL